MGLFDKVKNILFDETEEDEVETELPKRQHKKQQKQRLEEFGSDEDTIKEVKLTEDKEEKPSFSTDDYEQFSRTRMRENDYAVETPVRKEIPQEPVRQVVERPQYTRPIDIQPEKPVKEDRSRYELPPKKTVQHETRDYKKLLNESLTKEKKPFTVTPVISPVYGIIDKNYKPEEIVDLNKKEEKIDQVRERMFGPVSYSDEAIPEPTKYEVTEEEESLTETLIKENKIKEQEQQVKQDEMVSKGIEDEIETTSEFEIPEIEMSAIKKDKYADEDESPAIDISELLKDADIPSYDDTDVSSAVEDEYVPEDNYFKTESPDDFEPEEAEIRPEPRKEEVSESLDDTIETDLFNLIDSMYNTDERE